jgi:hypothetical protein
MDATRAVSGAAERVGPAVVSVEVRGGAAAGRGPAAGARNVAAVGPNAYEPTGSGYLHSQGRVITNERAGRRRA